MLWSVVAVAVGGWLLWRDYRQSLLPLRLWALATVEIVAASVLAFGWLWLLVRWVAR